MDRETRTVIGLSFPSPLPSPPLLRAREQWNLGRRPFRRYNPLSSRGEEINYAGESLAQLRFIHAVEKDPSIGCQQRYLLICHFMIWLREDHFTVTVYTRRVRSARADFAFPLLALCEKLETSFIIVNNVREGLTRFPLCVYRFTVILIGNRPRGASVLRYCKLVNRVRILGKLCRPLFISRLDDTRPMINDIHRSAAFCRELSDVDYRQIA